MMIPAWKPLVAAAAAVGSAAVGLFALMDCNPQLFLYDKFAYNPQDAYRGKCIWIIGASSGIGSELAIQLAQARCGRLILSGRNESRLMTLAEQLRVVVAAAAATATAASDSDNDEECCDCSTTICVVPMDVTDQESLERAFHQVQQQQQQQQPQGHYSRNLDMVVLNAGAGQLCPALETDPYVIQRIMQTNAIWPMILLPLLLQKNRLLLPSDDDTTMANTPPLPRILVTSSIAAILPVPLSGPYGAAKAALQHYFSTLASERPDLHITICCPGAVDSEFHSNHIMKSEKNGSNQNTQASPSTTTTTTTTEPDHAAVNDENNKDGSILTHNEGKTASQSSSPLKMPVSRCARLMLASAAKKRNQREGGGGLSETWVAQQPVLAALYLQQWAPAGWMRKVYAKIGTQRVQMWRDGLDLYDPKSWKTRSNTIRSSTTTTTTTANNNKSSR